MKKKAFTLVELIVVITILAILWTIAFISLSWYSKEARDSKRITDTSGLLSKINIEEVRWNTLDKLITNTRTATGQILWKTGSTFQTFWKANFKTLKEDEKNFEDPFKKWQHYPVAYTVWGNWKDAYKFVQIANVSEKENRNIIKWNYYTLSEQDNPSLFYSGSFYTEKPGSDLVYDLNWVVPKEPEIPKVWCANPKPSWDWIKNTTIWNPTEVNQVWVKDSPDCWFTCNDWYEWDNCEDLIIWITYSWNDIIVSDWVEKIVIADKNAWATKIADETICKVDWDSTCTAEYLGKHYQWGRNKWFTRTDSTQATAIDWSIWLDESKDIFNFVTTTSTTNITWAIWNIDNNWWWLNDTVDYTDISTIWDWKLRQWPCPDWYHVPSAKERKDLMKIWFSINNESCDVIAWTVCGWKWSLNITKLKKDLKIPWAWYRGWSWAYFINPNYWFFYRSSTPNKNETNSLSFTFSPNWVNPRGNTAKAFWAYIRCFKN